MSHLVKKDVNKDQIIFILITSIIILLILIILVILFNHNKKINIPNYYSFDETMEACGYQKINDNTFKKIVSNIAITITCDFNNEICNKNDYEFSLAEKIYKYHDDYYIEKDILEQMLNYNLAREGEEIVATQISFSPHEWTEYKLVAHAGGAVREEKYNTFYTNSLEALIQNYELGHRVFEFDFYLTSDNKLAVVHDWDQFGYANGVALSEEEWLQFKTYGSPMTESRFTTMMIGDLLDQMLINTDMFLVTDTKSVEFTEEEAKLQFQIIYEEALKRDVELLKRIVPQIYNEKMYDMIMKIYPFESVIYTCYATQDSSDQIIDFSVQHDNIKVITASIYDERFNKTAIEKLHNNQLLIYNHTIYNKDEMEKLFSFNIDGFYTGILVPKDVDCDIKK